MPLRCFTGMNFLFPSPLLISLWLWGRIFILGRNVPRKRHLVGGVKGHNMKRYYLTGKPRPVAGELHFAYISRKVPSDPRLFPLKTKKYLRRHPVDSWVEIYLFYENWSTETFRRNESNRWAARDICKGAVSSRLNNQRLLVGM